MATVKKWLTSGYTLNFKSVGIADGLCMEYESILDHCRSLEPNPDWNFLQSHSMLNLFVHIIHWLSLFSINF